MGWAQLGLQSHDNLSHLSYLVMRTQGTNWDDDDDYLIMSKNWIWSRNKKGKNEQGELNFQENYNQLLNRSTLILIQFIIIIFRWFWIYSYLVKI